MVVVADDEQVEVARRARDGGDLLMFAIEDGLAGDREPVRAPAALVVPVGRPDVVVVADDEQVEVARGAGDRSDLLLVVVEDGLAGDREPVRAPAALVVPVRGPDVVVVADDEQVEVAGRARDGRNPLRVVVEGSLPRRTEPLVTPTTHRGYSLFGELRGRSAASDPA